MPKPRLPAEVAKARGADRINPARFKGRGDPKTRPLGEPSVWLTDAQATAWEAFRAEIPWLAESDRTLVEVASVIRSRLMSGDDIGVQSLNLLRQCVAQMGGTPADRTKIVTNEEDNKNDPAAKYFAS